LCDELEMKLDEGRDELVRRKEMGTRYGHPR